MNNTDPHSPPATQRKGLGFPAVLAIILVTITVTVLVTFWILTHYVFPKQFNPVQLDEQEQHALDRKLSSFRGWGESDSVSGQNAQDSTNSNEPEKYSEIDANRTIRLTERELNALLAKNTDLAHRLAIDLSDNLASGKLLINMDPDFPVLGGKTIKLTAGLELSWQADRPIVILKGVSVMGVPIPNAWLGGVKNVDLVREFGQQEGLWKFFADGVKSIQVDDGQLVIELKE